MRITTLGTSHGEGEKTLRDIFASLPYPFDIAHDGDVFDI